MKYFGRHPGRLAAAALVVAGLVGITLLTTPVFAANCGAVETTIIDCSSANDTTGSAVVALLVTAIQILTAAIGIVAIGALVYAGILYGSASGNSSQVAKAKELIANTVIGMVLFAGMALVVNYLIPGGLFSGNATFGATDATEITLGGGAGAGTGNSGSGLNPSQGTVDITVATYNIRATNLTPWDNTRANSILNYIKTVDIVGVQEGRVESNSWLMPRLKTVGYAWSTTGKKENARKIYYNAKKFSLTKQGSKELHEKKDVVWIKLREKTSGTQFYVANVHLDVASTSARLSNLKTALPYIKNTLQDAPVIFIGDMNSKRGSTEDKLIQSSGFKDSYDVAATKSNLQYRTTVPGFKGGTTGKIQIKQHQIDHIYIKGSIVAKHIAVVLHKGSDHLPVQATIGISDGKPPRAPPADSTTTLKSVQNYRDLAALNSSIIKPGVVFRSAKLQDATTADRQALAQLLAGGAIIDLRTAPVRSSSPDPSITGVPNLNYPVEGVTGADGYVRAFVNSAAGRKQFGAAITKIANTQGAVLIHCTAGKDRTGWTAAMLMYIMGASDAQVMTEYLKSRDAGYEVDKSWLNAALSAARKNNGGSIMNYITSPTKGLGVSADTIAKLKAKLGP